VKRVFKLGCFGVIGVLLFIIALGVIFGDEESGTSTEVSKPMNNDTSKNTKSTDPVKKEEKVIASVGESIQVGNVVFTVNEVSTTKKIKDAGGFLSYKPESEGAVFLVVNVTVENAGKEAITTDASFFKLKDGTVEFSPSTIFTTDSKFFMYDGINPGLSKKGNVLFEIPENAQNLILNVQTGFWGTEQGEIKL
jgi:hypothetical protein